ncbi:MAG: 30S ribosomal protein S8 [Acidobacteria bacterium]|nr:30S ribosomal protein S8 [Acidobacteriota bacterium]TDI13674.1 MAG: 30S ribosomal protein S8 [Acidobacteriota bacterium]TDI15179.1 MAG: 30S ribosomal protein S8 [Acidobacteriota bacterium]
MSMTDPIADLLTRIRNAQMATDETVEMPFSKAKAEIVKILEEEGYIFGHTVTHSKPFSTLTVHLKYQSDKDPIIRCLKRVSKPGRRIYTRKGDIPVVLGGLGINILSTSKGVLTGKKARLAGVGGEILCEVY